MPGLPDESLESLRQRLSHLEKEMGEYRMRSGASGSPQSVPSMASSDSRPSAPVSPVFPAAFFLDVEVFEEKGMKPPKPSLAVPDDVLKAIGDEIDIQATVGAYFFSISTWMGMVSRKRLYRELAAQTIQLNSDIVLLILCMKLVNEGIPVGVFLNI